MFENENNDIHYFWLFIRSTVRQVITSFAQVNILHTCSSDKYKKLMLVPASSLPLSSVRLKLVVSSDENLILLVKKIVLHLYCSL